MSSEGGPVKRGGMGTHDERRKLRAQAAQLKGSGIQLRGRDETQDRVRRHKGRHSAERAVAFKTAGAVTGAVLALVVSGIFLFRYAVPTPRVTKEQLTDSGTFICKECTWQWSGEALRDHINDPFVKCESCHKRTARMAVQCPHCKKWVMEPFPEPVKPWAEMKKGDMRRWELKKHRMRGEVKCPKCGELLYRPRR